MKIFLKKYLAPLFLGVGGGWMADAEAGMEFKTGSQVIEYCRENRIPEAEIYYHFPDPRFDFATKVSLRKQD